MMSSCSLNVFNHQDFGLYHHKTYHSGMNEVFISLLAYAGPGCSYCVFFLVPISFKLTTIHTVSSSPLPDR